MGREKDCKQHGEELKVNDGQRTDEEVVAELKLCFQGKRLDVDAVVNTISVVSYAAQVPRLMMPKLEPLPTYRELVRQRHPDSEALWMKRSDPRAVAAFDSLIEAFNADLEHIKSTSETEAVRCFMEAVLVLVSERMED